jgi:hypothetical protein
MSMNVETDERRVPNGTAAAAIMAGGIGACTFGVLVVLSEASPYVADTLNFIESVGPLSGRVVVANLVWLVSWAALHSLWGNKQVNFGRTSWIAFALIVAGFVLTFPPVFGLFEG